MAKTPTPFFGPGWLTNTPNTVLYTPPAGMLALVKHIHVNNPSGAAATLFLARVVPAVSEGAQDRYFDAYSIAANTPFDHYCYYIIPGATASLAAYILQGWSGTNNVLTITVSGDLVGS